MKRLFLAISIVVVLAGLALGQRFETRGGASANNDTSVTRQGRQLELQSGTRVAAQMENTLDARHAKAGDRVALKTTQAVKQNGRVVIPKGAQLIGHVTDVQQQTKSNAESHIGVLIDRLRTGSTETPITASILSITQARSQSGMANNDLFESDTMAQSSARSSSAGSQRSGGGLLGGVGNTVGGAVNTTTGTVGNVVGSTTTAVGNTVGATTSTAGNLTGSLKGLQITQSGDASSSGGANLSLTGRNLHLETGTTFNLAVSNSTSAGTNP